MLNHFRTLLLNESYVGSGEHIPVGYNAKQLPNDLRQLYSLLFPIGSSRLYKHFLVHNYLNLLNGTGNTSDVLAYDNRITYDLTTSDFFKIDRISTVQASNPSFVLEVTNGFDTVAFNDYYYDHFTVKQVSNTQAVTVYSATKYAYLIDDSEFTSPSTDSWIELTHDNVNTTGTYYKEISIGRTGAKFRIIEPTPDALTGVNSITWDFVIEAPYVFDILSIFNLVEAHNSFNVLSRYADVAKYETIWDNNPNIIFKLSAFLLAFVTVINTL